MPFCPKCLKQVRQGQKFCPYDKSWLYMYVCARCFNEVMPEELFCTKCGADMKSAKKEQRCEFKWIGTGYRLLSGIIDILCCIYLFMVVYQIQYFLSHPLRAFLFYSCIVFFYFSFFNSSNRQTVGKQIMNTVSVRSNLTKISFSRSAIKALLILVTLGAGYLMFIFNIKTKQTWYDKITDIIVVEVPN